MIRFLDILFSFFGILLTLPVMVLLLLVGLFDTGSPLFFQKRVGRNKKPFTLVKFRTMALETRSVASHLADGSSVTKYGHFLRKTKLDELPQLFNVLVGDMSLVGPRPCLFNQNELIKQRELKSIFDVRPGITGLAQISGVDMSEPRKLAEVDSLMLKDLTLSKYISYIFKTAIGKGGGDALCK